MFRNSIPSNRTILQTENDQQQFAIDCKEGRKREEDRWLGGCVGTRTWTQPPPLLKVSSRRDNHANTARLCTRIEHVGRRNVVRIVSRVPLKCARVLYAHPSRSKQRVLARARALDSFVCPTLFVFAWENSPADVIPSPLIRSSSFYLRENIWTNNKSELNRVIPEKKRISPFLASQRTFPRLLSISLFLVYILYRYKRDPKRERTYINRDKGKYLRDQSGLNSGRRRSEVVSTDRP